MNREEFACTIKNEFLDTFTRAGAGARGAYYISLSDSERFSTTRAMAKGCRGDCGV